MRCWLPILILLWCVGLRAQGSFGDPIIERINTARLGGAHPMGFSVHEDPDGVLYLANVDGLVRVSGNRAQIFPLGGSSLVRTILPVGERLYVGGYDHYGYFGPDAEGKLGLTDQSADAAGTPQGTVWQLLSWRDAVLVLTGGRLLALQGNSRHEWPTPARSTAAFVLDDRLYLRADGIGLVVLDETELRFVPVPGTARLGDGPARSPLPWNDGVLIASEKHGLLHFDGRQLQHFGAPVGTPLEAEQAYALLALADGRVVVGTLAGNLHLLAADGRWLQSHSLVAAPILGLTESREGGLLVSTERGLYRVYWPSAWQRAGAERGVEGSIRSLLRRDGAIWLATSTGLYRRAELAERDAGFERLTAEIIDLRALDWVRDVPVVASDQGVQRWFGRQFGPALDALGSCYSMLPSEHHPGRFYSACDDGLLIGRLRDGELEEQASLRGDFARAAAVEEVDLDRLLVTLLDGPPQWLTLGPAGELLEARIVADGLADPDSAQVLYTGPARLEERYRVVADGRVYAWTGTAWRAISEPWPVELGDGREVMVLLDESGNELLISRRGLALRPAGQRSWRRVSLPGGDAAQIVGGRTDGGLFLWDEQRVWHALLGEAGIADLFAAPVPMQVRADRLLLQDGTGIRLLSGVAADREPFQLGAQLTVDFSLPTLAQPVEFRSRLGSPERPGDFGAWTSEATRMLPPLPQGRFRLEVEGRNALGVPAESLRLDFRVVAPWWHSRLLHLVGLLAVIALLASGGLVLRGTWLKRRNRELEQLVRERTEALSAANHRLKQLADRDGLTGLLNRRRFDSDWASALQDAAVAGTPIALVLIDLDHFKQYNDRHGHLVGDERLRDCAQWLSEWAGRMPEVAPYRYGGEEFAIILPALDVTEAAARVLELSAGAEQRFGADGTTLSVGLRCAVPAAGEGPLDWIASVDAALYAAKHAGRNRVMAVSGDGSVSRVMPSSV